MFESLDGGLWYYWERGAHRYCKMTAQTANELGFVHPYTERTSA